MFRRLYNKFESSFRARSISCQTVASAKSLCGNNWKTKFTVCANEHVPFTKRLKIKMTKFIAIREFNKWGVRCEIHIIRCQITKNKNGFSSRVILEKLLRFYHRRCRRSCRLCKMVIIIPWSHTVTNKLFNNFRWIFIPLLQAIIIRLSVALN